MPKKRKRTQSISTLNIRRYATICELLTSGKTTSINGTAKVMGMFHGGVEQVLLAVQREFGCDTVVGDRNGMEVTAKGRRLMAWAQNVVKALDVDPFAADKVEHTHDPSDPPVDEEFTRVLDFAMAAANRQAEEQPVTNQA